METSFIKLTPLINWFSNLKVNNWCLPSCVPSTRVALLTILSWNNNFFILSLCLVVKIVKWRQHLIYKKNLKLGRDLVFIIQRNLKLGQRLVFFIQKNLKWGRNFGILYRGILNQDAILVYFTEELKSERNFGILYRRILNEDAILVYYTEES